MKFMLIMQGTVKGYESLSTWSQEDFKRHIEFMHGFNQKLKDQGEFVMAEGLDLPHEARVVTAVPGGAPVVSDGPFPESKEFLAGYWIVDVPDAARAYAIAGEASAAPGKDGAPVCVPIEVRRIGTPPEV